MKKNTVAALFAVLTFSFAGPAFSDNIVQLWVCELSDGKTGQELLKVSNDWLKAAKTMEGGKDLAVYVEFAVVNASDGLKVNWVLTVPDLATWGKFNDGYSGSPAEKVDQAFNDLATCDGSSLWNSVPLQ